MEVIARGIWTDVAPDDAHAIAALHPFATDFEFGLVRTGETEGLPWSVRASQVATEELVMRSRLCSQRLFDFYLDLEGESRASTTCWLRTRNGVSRSLLSRRWGGADHSVDGVADLLRWNAAPHGLAWAT